MKGKFKYHSHIPIIYLIIIYRFRFKKSLRSMVNMSDKIGYIYWVAVLTTISFGFVTGIFESYRHKSNMQTKCNDKLNVYLTNYADQMLEWDVKFENGMATVNKINIIENAIKNFNTTIQLVDITCGRPRRVFPYHIWLPFDSKFTPVFQVRWMLNCIPLITWITDILFDIFLDNIPIKLSGWVFIGLLHFTNRPAGYELHAIYSISIWGAYAGFGECLLRFEVLHQF